MSEPKPVERPIIFSDAMVQALLAGHKTQTRRIIKGIDGDAVVLVSHDPQIDRRNEWHVLFEHEARRALKCPYGAVGDRLWVREAWGQPGTVPRSDDPVHEGGLVIYRATDGSLASTWRSPMFMPRWASRITLEITRIRAEPVQSITEEDARAEGAVYHAGDPFLEPGEDDRAVKCFSELWDGIYHDKPEKQWARNLWVWAIDFKVHLNTQRSLLQVLEAP